MRAPIFAAAVIAAVSGLELQAEQPSTYQFTTPFESRKFFNRLSGWSGSTTGGNNRILNDTRGWVSGGGITGTPLVRTQEGTDFFGGCRFKPAAMFEEYWNTLGLN